MSAPKFYKDFKKQNPKVVQAYEKLSQATRAAGPLDKKTAALVKLAIAIGSGLEGATHSAVRKAKAAGCKDDQLLHAVVLAATTLGFPAMMRARSWVLDVISKK